MPRQIASKAQRISSSSNHLLAASSRPMGATHPLLQLQQSIGNQAIQRLIQSPYIQAKLQTGAPNDQYEQEADRVADTIMRTPDSAAQPAAGNDQDKECGSYGRDEKAKTYSPKGILDLDVAFADFYGVNKKDTVVIADFGVNDEELNAAALAELKQPKSWIDIFENQSTKTLEFFGYSDCVGEKKRNVSLRKKRAEAVAKLFPKSKPRTTVVDGAPPSEYLADNTSAQGRAINRSVIIRYKEPPPTPTPKPTPTPTPTPSEPAVCIPPEEPTPYELFKSFVNDKRCTFYVYDSTEPNMAWKWKVAAYALAALTSNAWVIPSADNIEDTLEKIINSNATEGCDCIQEVQFFSHGSAGNAMSITKTGDEITKEDFNIPELEKFGYGPTKMSGYREWSEKLSVRQRRMVLLRRILCGPESSIYYRSCEAFQGKEGQEFAKASADFWRSNVVGHTKIIGLTQPGRKVIKPCQEPYWPESEGTAESCSAGGCTTGKKGKESLRDVKPKKD